MATDRNASRRGVEVVLLFTSFIAATYGFGVYLFPAIVEPIRVEIPFSYATQGTISGIVQAGFMVSSIAAGVMTLRFGAMRLIISALVVCSLCLAGMAVAPNIYTIGILLAILGGCSVIVWVPMVETSQEFISADHQGKALGLISSGTSYGVFINSLLMAYALPISGWRWIWGITAAIVAVLTTGAIIRLRGLRPETGSRSPSETPKHTTIWSSFRILANPLTAALSAIMFLNGLSCMPFQTFLSSYLEGEVGLLTPDAAYAWRVIGIVGMFSGFLMGALADRITVRLTMTLTYLILATACGTIAVVSNTSEIKLLVGAVAFGTAFYAIFGLVPAYISQSFGKGGAALTFSVTNIALGLGGITGNVLGGYVREATGSFVPAYLAMGVAALASAGISVLIPSERKNRVMARPIAG